MVYIQHLYSVGCMTHVAHLKWIWFSYFVWHISKLTFQNIFFKVFLWKTKWLSWVWWFIIHLTFWLCNPGSFGWGVWKFFKLNRVGDDRADKEPENNGESPGRGERSLQWKANHRREWPPKTKLLENDHQRDHEVSPTAPIFTTARVHGKMYHQRLRNPCKNPNHYKLLGDFSRPKQLEKPG